MKIAVWVARLILGGTFLLSGVTKMVDPYGSLAKIDAYLGAWGLMQTIPPGLVLVGGCALALVEFIVGLLLATGSLRRTAAWSVTAIMAFMLPLTVYIAIVNPVDDCGCFGDFLILSNVATMLKNVVLMALAIFLCRYNRRARWLFAPWIQWVEIAAGVAYMLLLAIIGYHEQPLLDFRAYPVGEPLVEEGEEAVYVYQRGGEVRVFTEDELPDDDSGWEFVRADVVPSPKALALFDRTTGRDVTEEVLGVTPGQMLLLFPYPSDASAAGSYTANELQQAMESRFGRGAFVGVTAGDSTAVAHALDLMMATYPVYYADAKAISAVARGHMAVIYLKDGVVAWKRTLTSINLDRITPDSDLSQTFAVNGPRIFGRITLLYVFINLGIFLLGLFPALFRLRKKKNG
ncbi:MAG: DoxX family protein [Bacteroides sp.]|nr:DoxX family protein [Bacteroides sp.]MCM1378773.1 DoxX family protein [Bacteroides sp.]MCM1445390.1 DoxX family protein [Prevotella sp.]